MMYYFIGGAGNGNFGDELIVKCWLDFLAESGYEGDIVFDENHARISHDFFGDNYPSVKFTDDVSQLKRKGPKDFFLSLIRGLRFYENGGFERHPDLIHLADQFSSLEVLHLHGGGYINTIWPHNAFLLGFAAATKRKYGCKIVATGLGILPAPTPPSEHFEAFRQVVEDFDILEVRDRWAFDYLRKVSSSPRIICGLDDTYLMRSIAGSGRRTLHYSFFTSADKFDRVLAHARSDEANRFERILFWACVNKDAECFEQLVSVCPRAECISWESLVHGPIPVTPGDFMITARFHPHLLAARSGAHGVFRTDGGYYDFKHGSVVDLGSPFVVMKDEITEGAMNSFSAIHTFDTMRVNTKRRLAAYIYNSTV